MCYLISIYEGAVVTSVRQSVSPSVRRSLCRIVRILFYSKDNFLYENHRDGPNLTLLNVLNMPKDASLACCALIIYGHILTDKNYTLLGKTRQKALPRKSLKEPHFWYLILTILPHWKLQNFMSFGEALFSVICLGDIEGQSQKLQIWFRSNIWFHLFSSLIVKKNFLYKLMVWFC